MRETARKGLFWLWGRAMYRFRWVVIAFWIVCFLGLALFAQKAPELLKDNGFTPYGSESEKGLQKLQENLGFPASTMNIIYESDAADLTQEPMKAEIMDSLTTLKTLPYVQAIAFNTANRLSDNKHIQSVLVSLKLDTDEALINFPKMKRHIHAPEGMKVRITGGTPVMYDMQQASKKDIVKAEMIGLPIALVVLLIVFGTVLGALLPMIVGVMSVTVTLGITYFIAQNESLSNFLPNMVTMLGLAVGIDYALFMVSRFREELKRQPDVQEAVAMTCQMAGRSIFFSGIAVLIGLLGMLFIDLIIFQTLCLGGVLVVSISVLVGNTLLLSLLGIFGHKINVLQIVPSSWKRKGGSKFWEKVAYSVMKRPIALVLVIVIGLIYFMLPLSSMKLGIPSAEVLPPSYESRLGADLLNKTFDRREMSPIQIAVLTNKEIEDEDTIRDIDRYVRSLSKLAGVKEVISYTNGLGTSDPRQMQRLLQNKEIARKIEMMAKDRTAVITVVPTTNPDDIITEHLVENIRSIQTERFTAYVTGETAYRLDIVNRVNDRIPEVLGFVMGITYIVLLIAFRSVLLPLKAVLMNVLSLGASLGIVVSVFQQGHFADLLHITSTGYVNATLPVIIFCVVFGISMDYEVFLISRIVEEYETTGNNERSTAEGLKKTGSLITSAAFILVVVVGSFIFTDIEFMKALGLGLALAVVIDATIIRVVVVPALMKILGKANWWAPKWIKPVKPKTQQN